MDPNDENEDYATAKKSRTGEKGANVNLQQYGYGTSSSSQMQKQSQEEKQEQEHEHLPFYSGQTASKTATGTSPDPQGTSHDAPAGERITSVPVDTSATTTAATSPTSSPTEASGQSSRSSEIRGPPPSLGQMGPAPAYVRANMFPPYGVGPSGLSFGTSSHAMIPGSSGGDAVWGPNYHEPRRTLSAVETTQGKSRQFSSHTSGKMYNISGMSFPSGIHDPSSSTLHPVGGSSIGRHPSMGNLLAIKLLVSNNVAGSIIGRSGQTISELQLQSASRIKLSQSGDYYPGTQDRVCLIQGEQESVKKAVELIFTRLYALHRQQLQEAFRQNEAYRHGEGGGTDFAEGGGAEGSTSGPNFLLSAPNSSSFVVRLLVPTLSCGMLIGRGGSNIKYMIEATRVTSIRLSPKEGDGADASAASIVARTMERIVTITGPNLASCLSCMFIILDGMAASPEMSRYPNMTTSYSRMMPAAQASVAQTDLVESLGIPRSASTPLLHSAAKGGGVPAPLVPTDKEQTSVQSQQQGMGETMGRPLDPHSITSPPVQHDSPWEQPSRFSQQQSESPETLRYAPASDPTGALFCSPDHASHSQPSRTLLGQAGTSRTFSESQHFVLTTMNPPSAQWTSGGAASNTTSSSNPISSPLLVAAHLQQSLHVTPPADHPSPTAAQTISPAGAELQMDIPDSLIGSILGRAGKSLNELQSQTGTKIRISPRGVFVPGTTNRVVSIRGPTNECVALAHQLIRQRISVPASSSKKQTQTPASRRKSHKEQESSSSDAGTEGDKKR